MAGRRLFLAASLVGAMLGAGCIPGSDIHPDPRSQLEVGPPGSPGKGGFGGVSEAAPSGKSFDGGGMSSGPGHPGAGKGPGLGGAGGHPKGGTAEESAMVKGGSG